MAITTAFDSDYTALGVIAARELVKSLRDKDGAPWTLGLCGGRSVVPVLQALRQEMSGLSPEVLRSANFFMADERLVPFSDEQSNFGLVNREFLEPLVTAGLISKLQVHPFDTEGESEFACGQYLKELHTFGPNFDAVVLGMGEDGHVAGLFPGHVSLDVDSVDFVVFNDSPKPPPSRVTASRPLIEASGMIVLLALGAGKAQAFRRLHDSMVPLSECPAKMVLNGKDTLIVTDLS